MYRHATPVVATVMEAGTRSRLDAAVGNRCRAIHANTVLDAIRTVRMKPVEAVLVSPRAVDRDQLAALSRLVDGFPGVLTLAVVAGHDSDSSARLLSLGAHGVRELIDLSDRAGWQRLRNLVSQPTSATAAAILSEVLPSLGSANAETRKFFEVLVRIGPQTASVRRLCLSLGATTSTFVSRFMRAGLPSPKQYLAGVRLVYAAALLGAPGRAVADVAHRLDFSSPQSFGRHLRNTMGLTASEFRSRFTFGDALADYVARHITPFRAVFRNFHPLNLG